MQSAHHGKLWMMDNFNPGDVYPPEGYWISVTFPSLKVDLHVFVNIDLFGSQVHNATGGPSEAVTWSAVWPNFDADRRQPL